MSQFVVVSDEYIAASPFLTLNGNNIENSDKQDIVSNKEFEAMITSIKKYSYHQCMMNFVDKVELSDKKYQTNGYVRDENYKGKFLLLMKDFVSFITYCQSMYFMSTKL